MISYSKLSFWAKRGIPSLEEGTISDEDQDLQRLRYRSSGASTPESQASSPPWSTLHDTPPSEEDRVT